MILTERDGKMSEGRSITRKDIAREAGVSISVVSRALNNSGYVEKEKKSELLTLPTSMDIFPIRLPWHYSRKKLTNCSFSAEI